jgi:hypothetical protein
MLAYMKYLELYNKEPLEHLSNAEYKTVNAEPSYTLLVALYKILPKDIIQIIIQYNSVLKPLNLTGRTIRRLDNSIEKGLFTEFKTIYDTEYMRDPLISNFFEFIDQSRYPTCFNYYDLCSCRTCCNNEYFGNFSGNLPCNLCEPIRIGRNFYIKECRCQNGKRFLAFQMVYKIAYEIIDIKQRNKGKVKGKGKGKGKGKYNNPYQLMVDHIISSGPIDLKYNPVIEEY